MQEACVCGILRKFATMFFAQALKIPSIHIVGVVDIKNVRILSIPLFILIKVYYKYSSNNL